MKKFDYPELEIIRVRTEDTNDMSSRNRSGEPEDV